MSSTDPGGAEGGRRRPREAASDAAERQRWSDARAWAAREGPGGSAGGRSGGWGGGWGGRGGRGLGPILLWLPLLAGALWTLHRLETRGPLDPSLGERVELDPLDPALAGGEPLVAGLQGARDLAGGRLLVRLTPLLPLPRDQEFRSSSLRRALDLPAGEPWRLEVEHHGSSVPPPPTGPAGEPPAGAAPGGGELSLSGLALADDEGVAQRLLVEAIPAGAAPLHPLRTLYAPPARLAPGERVQLALWGRRPRGAAVLRLARPETLEVSLAPVDVGVEDLPAWFARATRVAAASGAVERLVEAGVEAGKDAGATGGAEDVADAGTGGPAPADEPPPPDPRDAEIERLRADLLREQVRRQERELAWLEYNRALARLDLDELLEPFPIDPEHAPDEVPLPGPDDPPLGEEVPGDAARAAEIAQAMNALLRVEGVDGYDLLEAGMLESGAVGPVVFRLLDERGRLAGSLFAERMRLEGSRAAKSLTIVLERGHESRGGERLGFDQGVRRIQLPRVDPVPWMDAMPELFRVRDLAPPGDDGLWDVEAVRRELNRLLGLDISAGWYRLQGLGGVLGDTLTDVHLESFDASGRIERRYFADRLRVALDEGSVVLALEGGAIVRGDQKDAFPGGKHRLFLPRARAEDWRGARLPGLAPAAGAAQADAAMEDGTPAQEAGAAGDGGEHR